MELGNQRDAFDVPDDVAYFNTASLAPQLRVVREAGEAALAQQAAPWRTKSVEWFTDVEILRGLFAQLIGVEPDGVALIPATSYGMAVAARNLPVAAGQRILVLAEEYPSGIYTWRAVARRTGAEIVTVEREGGRSWADAILTALVDLAAVAPAARSVGAALVIDATQSLGAMELDMARIAPDFVMAAGYKWLLGPFSVGYLYVAERHRDGEPLEENWILREGSEDFARLVDYRDEYQPGARRFDVGQRTNFTLTPMAIAALTQLLDWGVPQISESLATVTEQIERRATSLGLEAIPASQRGPHMLGVRMPESALAAAVPALTDANCFAGVRGSSLRLSPHLFTTQRDIERLFAALASVLTPA
jgi:selenocysteine lyase/cysteine desulfurase